MRTVCNHQSKSVLCVCVCVSVPPPLASPLRLELYCTGGLDDGDVEIREDQAGMWLFLASLQFHSVHSNIPIINNLIVNSLLLNDHLLNIIH